MLYELLSRGCELARIGEAKSMPTIQLLADAHILCLPTYYYEGQPIAILEAYATGCVVITTNHGGIPDIFEPGRNGFYVEKRSAKSIADIIETLLVQNGQLEQIAIRNNAIARNLYNKSRCLASLISIIEQKCA
jgi:glycosyltransferase involved in cell wall biosynthesis